MVHEIAIDLSRLLLGSWRSTPRGIDRTEMLFGRHFLSHWDGPCCAIVPTPWGVRRYERDHALRGLDYIERAWRDRPGPAGDGLDQVNRWLAGNARIKGLDLRRERIGPSAWKFVRDVGLAWGQPAATGVQRNANYLNVGHVGLSRDFLLHWLTRRSDVKPVFFIHDVIPLEYPEFVAPSERAFFQRLSRNVARYAKGLIVSTHAVERSVASFVSPALPPVLVAPQPVSSTFANSSPSAQPPVGPPYFVTIGQLDRRKNHRLLLDAWRAIATSHRGPVPKLLIVGIPGNASGDIKRHLDKWDPERNHVLEVTGLPTSSMIALMRGARALLMPSLAEGFGFPVVEALATGTPVIASDIAVHREVGGASTTYLDPRDPQAWVDTIVNSSANARRPAEAAPPGHTVWTTERYFRVVENFLANL